MWKSLRHPNVLPLLGVPSDRSRFRFAMVSEWMANDTINRFVGMRREINRFKLVRFWSAARHTHHSNHAISAVGGRC